MGRLFGTDGIRGIANDFLNPLRVMQIGSAVAYDMTKMSRHREFILIGMDTRLSSDMMESALAAGITSVGVDVINLGVIPTPAIAFLVRKLGARAGIMISASHNPAEFNGIKVFNEDGYKLPDELEEHIEAIVLGETKPPKLCEGDKIGRVTVKPDALDIYIDFIKSSIKGDLSGLEIAFDCANGSSSVTAEKLFSSLGVKCHMLSDKPDGLNINRGCGSTHLEALAEYVTKNKLDMGVAFDGDADRCLCVDGDGKVVDGDIIMAILSKDMKDRGVLAGNAVVGTIMSNFGFVKFCEANDIHFISTKVGDRYVLEAMRLEGYCFGGEQSGHLIFSDFATTGDGQLTALQILALIKRTGKKFSDLSKIMTKYPQVMVNITVSNEAKLAFYTDDDVRDILEKAKEEIGDGGRLVVRPSGTEPLIRVMAEGEDRDAIEVIVKRVAKEIELKLKTY